MCVVLSAAAGFGARKPAPDAPFRAKLDRNSHALHAVERLTFGPRPGDVEAVRRLGVKKWVDLQLHPERIPENPELARRLAPLDSLRMSTLELQQHYPTRQYARAVMNGRAEMPDDPGARRAIENMIARFKAKQDGTKSDAQVTDLREIVAGDALRTLRTGTREDKRAILVSLQPDQVQQVAEALPPGMRAGLIAIAPTSVRRELLAVNSPERVIADDLAEARVYRAIYSNRQLEEELTDFWFNHFNVFLDKGADRYLVSEYERDAIRPYVLGRFRDLLEATAKSPAMLFYLDNWQSMGAHSDAAQRARRDRGLNENYGRELLELHTLGVDGGYTQRDVTEVARCFTGWTIKGPVEGGGFFYNDRWHDKGAKTVLAVAIPAGGGEEDGERVLDILAKSPATAHHICLELAQKFVADNPPERLVARMAQSFLKTDGDLRQVLKTMLDSPEFWSHGADRAKVKTPFEMVISAVRASGAQVDDAHGLVNEIAKLGEPLYRKLEPTGYSSISAEWVSSDTLLDRMNFAAALATNRIADVHVDTAQFNGKAADQIAHALLDREASTQTRAAIEEADPFLVPGLVLGSPDFQRK